LSTGGGILSWIHQGSPLQIVQETAVSAADKLFYGERVINAWNYLPYDIVCFRSLNAFNFLNGVLYV